MKQRNKTGETREEIQEINTMKEWEKRETRIMRKTEEESRDRKEEGRERSTRGEENKRGATR
jgi:hypothetical protein